MGKTVVDNHKLYLNNPNLPDGKKFIELLYYPNSHAYKVDGVKLIGVSSIPDVIDKPGLRFYYMNEALNYIKRVLIPNKDGKFVMPVSEDEWDTFVKEAKSAHKTKSDRGKENGTRIHAWLEEFCIAKRDGLDLPALPERIEILKNPKTWVELDVIEVNTEWNNLVDALEEFIGWYEKHEIEVVALEQLVFSYRYQYAGRFDAILRIDGKLTLVDFKTNNPSQEFPQGIFPEMYDQIAGYDIAYTEEFYPDLDKANQSVFDAHAVFNFNKKKGRFYKKFIDADDIKVNRSWFIHTLGTKRGQQHNVRKLSMKYRENKKGDKNVQKTTK